MIEIPLTRGYVAIVDDEDADLAQLRWLAKGPEHRHTVYAYRYECGGSKVRSIKLHRVILDRMGFGPDTLPDHIDGNGLNCCRSNLRAATRAENARNRRKGRNNTSGYKGVSWRRARCTWVAEIKVCGKKIVIGTFHSVIDAARAYDEAARRFHGAFARPNFP